MRDTNQTEAVKFERYCRLDGSIAPAEIIRRNGYPEMQFPAAAVEFPVHYVGDETAEYKELLDEICQNLNEIERRTWLKIIDGRSILDIAADEEVARAAIYDRIRRMVKKNDYCAIWWRLKKNKLNQHK